MSITLDNKAKLEIFKSILPTDFIVRKRVIIDGITHFEPYEYKIRFADGYQGTSLQNDLIDVICATTQGIVKGTNMYDINDLNVRIVDNKYLFITHQFYKSDEAMKEVYLLKPSSSVISKYVS